MNLFDKLKEQIGGRVHSPNSFLTDDEFIVDVVEMNDDFDGVHVGTLPDADVGIKPDQLFYVNKNGLVEYLKDYKSFAADPVVKQAMQETEDIIVEYVMDNQKQIAASGLVGGLIGLATAGRENDKAVYDLNRKFKNLKEKEDYFWAVAPDSISFDELKEFNYKVYNQLVEIAKELVAAGRLTVQQYEANIGKSLAMKSVASSSRYCAFYPTTDGKWYMELAPREYGEYDSADTYGPFDTEEAAIKYLDDNFSNPGGWDSYNESKEAPTKSPNGKPVQKPSRGRSMWSTEAGNRQKEWFDHPDCPGKGVASNNELDITVYKDKKRIAGGIDGDFTRKYTAETLVKKVEELFDDYQATTIIVTSRADGGMVYAAGEKMGTASASAEILGFGVSTKVEDGREVDIYEVECDYQIIDGVQAAKVILDDLSYHDTIGKMLTDLSNTDRIILNGVDVDMEQLHNELATASSNCDHSINDKGVCEYCGMSEHECEEDDAYEVISMTVDEVISKDEKFRYQLLSRLQSDCEYFINNGHQKHLWAGSVGDQIKYMKEIWNSLSDKPEWLSLEEIGEYERKMSTACEANAATDKIDRGQVETINKILDMVGSMGEIASQLFASGTFHFGAEIFENRSEYDEALGDFVLFGGSNDPKPTPNSSVEMDASQAKVVKEAWQLFDSLGEQASRFLATMVFNNIKIWESDEDEYKEATDLYSSLTGDDKPTLN